MRLRIVFLFWALYLFLPAAPARAVVYSYGKSSVIGAVRTYAVKGDESLIEIARKFGLGYNEIVEANPELDPFVPGNGSIVQIPTSWVLPETRAKEGIVINLVEMRLYYFFRQRKTNLVMTLPIGIGSEGTNTPTGKFRVTRKVTNPSWYVPESIRRENPELPKVVPPGPDNPLGSHELRLSIGSVLIHGTNRPFAIGRKASHGCIRLYPEDIPELFRLVSVNTPVIVARQPVKVGMKQNKVYLEAHKDDSGKSLNYFDEAIQLLRKNNLLKYISTEKLHRAIEGKKGVPVEISQ